MLAALRCLLCPIDSQPCSFWQSWAPNHPDRRLTVELWVARQWDSKISAHFTGLFFGPKHEFEALWLAEVEPVIRANMTCNETGALDYMIAAGGVKSEVSRVVVSVCVVCVGGGCSLAWRGSE